ncbi:DUF2441 domain-containing protein [Niallia taxi]|uniref:DUF2441 domain-containing protein n=1 Tax=Niallia taxi TaxID=2499688 RepID=UPI00254E1DDC|nr:DUF2441 domain-containing protein [Niallia taxi]MDK8641324.1 DUF2441 domain-containing protein [Niallia taxi]
MQKVKDEILYHFNAKNGLNHFSLLEHGSIIKTENFNPFRNSYEKGSIDYDQHPIATAKAYWRFTKEYVFEQTRMNINNELPSRWKCLWLTEENNKDYWNKYYTDVEYKLLKLKVTGNIFIADAYWVETEKPIPLEHVGQRAIHYWNGDIFRNGKQEILFEGTAEVIDVVDHFIPSK